MPSPSPGSQGNPGGAHRGHDRADEVHERNAERQANRPPEDDDMEVEEPVAPAPEPAAPVEPTPAPPEGPAVV